MNLWTLKKLVIGANAEGVRKVKAAFRFDCGAEEIADFPRGASAAALCAIQAKRAEREEPTGAEHLRYGEGCAGVLTFGELEREAATTEVALKIKIEDAVCVVDATFTLHDPDDSAWLTMQVGQALDVGWSQSQGVLL